MLVQLTQAAVYIPKDIKGVLVRGFIYIYVCIHMPCICYTYTTGLSALPDIYVQARGPQARAYISGKARVPVV